jgi:hypothetical protein
MIIQLILKLFIKIYISEVRSYDAYQIIDLFTIIQLINICRMR